MEKIVVTTDAELNVVDVDGDWQLILAQPVLPEGRSRAYPDILSGLQDENRDDLLAGLRKVLDRETDYHANRVVCLHDGQGYAVDIFAAGSRSGGLVIDHQISRSILDDSQGSESFSSILELLAGSETDWYWESGPRGRIRRVVGLSERNSNFVPEDFLGKKREEYAVNLENPETARNYSRTLEDRLPFHDLILKVANTRSPYGYCYVRSSGAPVFDQSGTFRGYRGLARDITSEKILEEHLADALDAMEEGVAIWDQEDRLVLINDRYRELYPRISEFMTIGITFENLLRKATRAGVYPIPEDRIEAFIAERLERHLNPGEVILQAVEGGRYIRISERRTANGCIISSWLDVTDLQEREIDLASARMEAEAANRAKDRFLQNMSHELRTPLNAIIGFTDLMMHEPFGEIGHPNYREYLESIGESGRNLLNIIAQILDYVGAAGGTDRIAEEYFQVDEFIAGCITVARRDMRKRTLKIRTELDGCAGYVLNGDRSKLQVALGNLISNALKFSTDWESVMIDVRLTEDGGMVFSVLDKGCGISQEDVSRALVSFEQLEPHLVKRTSGIGLGLPLASRIMELHGGRLEIAQGTSGGTRASLVLPPERVVGQDGSVVSLPG